ncbi:alpha/beta hydrolase-fold protein [Isosphaeraceae bacterium EP7]
MRRLVAALALLAATASPARAQLFEPIGLDHLNGKLCGRVVDYTSNHGADRRLVSNVLGGPRDLYVYLPPGYNPALSYPLIVLLHSADVDEHGLLDPVVLKQLDRMMDRGELGPAIIAAPDGTYEGKNRLNATHSFWINGLGGRFEDHLIDEVVPFLVRTYPIRPEARAHALLGISAGGYGAMAIALRHRDLFGVVATLAGPLNMLYNTCDDRYGDDFDPATFRERNQYDPEMVIARYYHGFLTRRVKRYVGPVYGSGPDVLSRIAHDNPYDLINRTDLRPGQLEIYVNFPGRDNYNFDAQARSFAWLAASRGIAVDLTENPEAHHDLRYFRAAQIPAYRWLGTHLLPPAAR